MRGRRKYNCSWLEGRRLRKCEMIARRKLKSLVTRILKDMKARENVK